MNPDAAGSTIVQLTGDIDVGNASSVAAELTDLVGRGHTAVVVDCSAITFVESRGLAMMARVQRFADDTGCRLTWRGLPVHVLRSMHVAGLDRYLRIEA
jgi:anti-anti-sigma factor